MNSSSLAERPGQRPDFRERYQLEIPRDALAIAVLIPGSGPTTRTGLARNQEGAIADNSCFDPFAKWQSSLLENGIGCLRYDKTVFSPNFGADGLPECLGIRDEYLADISLALEACRKAQGGKDLPIFLVGHSLGGLAALIAANDTKLVCGVVCVAMPRFNLVLTLWKQLRPRLKLAEGVDEQTHLKRELCKLNDVIHGRAANAFGIRAEYWLDYAQHRPLSLVRECRSRHVLLISGRDDPLVSSRDWTRISELADEKPSIIVERLPYGDHFLLTNDPSVVDPISPISIWIRACCM